MISNYTYNKCIMTYFSAPDAQLFLCCMGLGYKISSSDLEKNISTTSKQPTCSGPHEVRARRSSVKLSSSLNSYLHLYIYIIIFMTLLSLCQESQRGITLYKTSHVTRLTRSYRGVLMQVTLVTCLTCVT